jgi:hypothetical protein
MDQPPARSVSLGFQAAAFVNVAGILLFSLAFTNQALISHSPVVFSRFGLVCIVLWGLAYLAVARTYAHVPALVAVFALEKLAYVATWVDWMSRFGAEWPRLWSESPLTAVFYASYGPNDLAFGLFFAWVAWTTSRGR